MRCESSSSHVPFKLSVEKSRNFEDSHFGHSKSGGRRVKSLAKGKPQAESEPGTDSQAQP